MRTIDKGSPFQREDNERNMKAVTAGGKLTYHVSLGPDKLFLKDVAPKHFL